MLERYSLNRQLSKACQSERSRPLPTLSSYGIAAGILGDETKHTCVAGFRARADSLVFQEPARREIPWKTVYRLNGAPTLKACPLQPGVRF